MCVRKVVITMGEKSLLYAYSVSHISSRCFTRSNNLHDLLLLESIIPVLMKIVMIYDETETVVVVVVVGLEMQQM